MTSKILVHFLYPHFYLSHQEKSGFEIICTAQGPSISSFIFHMFIINNQCLHSFQCFCICFEFLSYFNFSRQEYEIICGTAQGATTSSFFLVLCRQFLMCLYFFCICICICMCTCILSLLSGEIQQEIICCTAQDATISNLYFICSIVSAQFSMYLYLFSICICICIFISLIWRNQGMRLSAALQRTPPFPIHTFAAGSVASSHTKPTSSVKNILNTIF